MKAMLRAELLGHWPGPVYADGAMMRHSDLRAIGVLCSGGDAPGMNAGVRAVTRAAIYRGIDVWGVLDGYNGLVEQRTEKLTARSVSGLLQRGGSLIGSGRCDAFLDGAVREACVAYLREQGIEGLVVLGGDGSLEGAMQLHRLGLPVAVVPATIDNDMLGTEITVGADTAVNTAMEAIDRLNETASAHSRAMIVEVMGRHCGYLAIQAGIAAGAELILTPERPVELGSIFEQMAEAVAQGKNRFVIVLAEGAQWHASELTQLINDADNPYDARFTILGYIQRGGSPSRFDRILATRMGVAAVEALLDGQSGVLAAWQRNGVELISGDELPPRADPWGASMAHVHRITAV